MKKLLLATALMIIMIMFTGCDSDPTEQIDAEQLTSFDDGGDIVDGDGDDIRKPKITSPDNGSKFTVGDTILIETDFRDPDDIDVVRFWINDGSSNKVAFTDNEQPFEFDWTPTSAGSYKLWIKSRDTAGKPKVSNKVTVIVNAEGDDTHTAEITFPDNGSTFTVGDTILVETDFPYSDDIDVVRFWINDGESNNVAFTDTSNPFKFNWKPTSPGSYKLWIKARDTSGNPIVSEKITVMVNEDGDDTHTAEITFPDNGSTFTVGDTILVETDFLSPDDIDVVRFWINDGKSNKVAFTDSSNPFEFNWKPTSPGSYKLWIKALDNAGKPVVSDKITVIVNDGGGDHTLKPHPVLKVPVAPNSGKKHKPTQEFTIQATAKAGEWEILGLGGSGGSMDSGEINDIKKQGFKYLGGGGPGDKNAYIFCRKMSSSSRDIKVNRYANHTMFIYDSKSDSELSKYGIDLNKNGSIKTSHGNYSEGKGANVNGLSVLTTDDGVKNVQCGSADVLAADDSHRGDGVFLIYGKGKFIAERNDKKGGKQLQYVSFTN